MRSINAEIATQKREAIRKTESIIEDLLTDLQNSIADKVRLEAELDEISLTSAERRYVYSQERADDELHAEWEETK